MARTNKKSSTPQQHFTVLKWKANELSRRKSGSKAVDSDEAENDVTKATPAKPSKSELRHEFASYRDLPLLDGVSNAQYDPFGFRRSEDKDPVVQAALHNSIASGWASLVPIKAADGTYPIVRTFLEFMHADEGNYYTYMYCGTIHSAINSYGPKALNAPLLISLQVKHKTYRRLQDRIDALDGRPASDDILSIILSLAVHDVNPEALTLVPPPYAKSPLSKFQLLPGVGFMKPQVTHFLALYRLVAQRGGIHQIKTFGIAHTLALADLIRATVTGSMPMFDCFWSQTSPIDKGTNIDMKAVILSSGFGSRLTNLAGLSLHKLAPFIELVPALRDVTVLIDMYQRTGGQEPDTGDVVMFANSVQYRILCMGCLDIPESAPDPESQTLKLLRLALLLYSDLVIFPLGYASGVRSGRAKDIWKIMQHRDSYRIYEPHLEMWVLCMAFFGCLPDHTNSMEGGWLGNKLKNMIDFTCAKGQDRKQFLDIMRGFIWWDVVCKDYIKDMWEGLFPSQPVSQDSREGTPIAPVSDDSIQPTHPTYGRSWR